MSTTTYLFDLLRSHSSSVCIDELGRSTTYCEILEEVDRLRTHFDQIGIVPGTVVALHADYSVASLAALLAMVDRGAITAFMPRSGDQSRYMRDAHAQVRLEVNSDGTSVISILDNVSGHPLFDTLRSTSTAGFILFTSGTSGFPKAVLQSTDRFLRKFLRRGRALRTLALLLFDHIGGLDTLFYTIMNGGTLIPTSQRDPQSVLRIIDVLQVEVLPASPSFLRLLCTAPNWGHSLSSLKVITYGAEPMDADTLRRLNVRFPNAQILQKYGTTETGSPRTITRSNDSLWLKLGDDDVQAKVVNGLLYLRSEGAMLGYLNAPNPIDPEGWYCTGDLVDVDGDWVKFRGRQSDVINVGGEKVAPTEVEQTILELEFVQDALVFGESHTLLGQVVRARVTLIRPLQHRIAANLIRMHCRQRLASYKVPVAVEIVDAQQSSGGRKKVRRGPG